jgi:hypothetical protein
MRESTLRVMTGESGEAEAGAESHAYPSDVARRVHATWRETYRDGAGAAELPALAVLENVISVCYQASLLREEGRPATFRLALADPRQFAASGGPPAGLHRLLFLEPRMLDAHQLRRLAPAAEFHRSIIGARVTGGDAPQIWGILHSGLRWLQSVRGGREGHHDAPAFLTLAVTGPGRVLVSHGATTLAELADGKLDGHGMDVLQAPWISELFADAAGALPSASSRGSGPSLILDPAFAPLLARHVVRRILATVRSAQHGGTLIFLPHVLAADVIAAHHVTLKYQFQDEEPRRRLVTLANQIVEELVTSVLASATLPVVGWSEYERSRSPSLMALDEALFEVAHLVADLSAVDGAVVLTDRLELLGFGGEIAGSLREVRNVVRALDLRGARRERVRTDLVGTRHRSAYRLCETVKRALAVVISQDGALRFVRWHDNAVTFWDQVATGPWEA